MKLILVKKRFIPQQKDEKELFSEEYNIPEGPYFDKTYKDVKISITGGDDDPPALME